MLWELWDGTTLAHRGGAAFLRRERTGWDEVDRFGLVIRHGIATVYGSTASPEAKHYVLARIAAVPGVATIRDRIDAVESGR